MGQLDEVQQELREVKSLLKILLKKKDNTKRIMRSQEIADKLGMKLSTFRAKWGALTEEGYPIFKGPAGISAFEHELDLFIIRKSKESYNL